MGTVTRAVKHARASLARALPHDWRVRVERARHHARRASARLRGMPKDVVLHGSIGRPRTAVVVRRFDAHASREEHFETVRAALINHDVEHVVLPRQPGEARRIVVAASDRARFGRAVSGLGTGWWATTVRGIAGPTVTTTLASAVNGLLAEGSTATVVTLFRYLASPSGTLLAGARLGVSVELWSAVETDGLPRADGSTFEAGTYLAPRPNRVAAYLTPAAWHAAQSVPANWPQDPPLPHLFDVTEPIDLVYTWVDGNDPEWAARRDAALNGTDVAQFNEAAFSDTRFIEHDELRYSLRSVEMHANWARRIYLVTDRQVPAWLDTSHSKIQVVDHREIFREPSVLPVFNSHAIESQLHHIPGLSRRYVYMNDDVFFGRPVEPELFFEGNGLTKFFVSNAVLDIDPASKRDIAVTSAAKNNRDLIAQHFGRLVTNKFKHTPHPQNRELLEELEGRWPELFETVARSRFRHHDDYSITSALHHYYGYATARAVRGSIRYDYFNLDDAATPRRLSALRERRNFDVFCLNDTDGTAQDAGARRNMLIEFLSAYFPLPSSFER